jgi:hypothetical protein
VDAATGHYAGEPTELSTTIEMVDVTRPDHVTLDGRDVGTGSGSDPRWSYQASTATLTVDIGSRPVDHKAVVVAVGSTTVAPGPPTGASSSSS